MQTNVALQQDVIAELSYEPSIDATNIGVGVVAEGGVITLSGTVPDYLGKCGAEHVPEHAAWSAPGVSKVENNLHLAVQ